MTTERTIYISRQSCWHSHKAAEKDWHDLTQDWETLNFQAKEKRRAEFNQTVLEKYGRLCVELGPEEGAFYSTPYCKECLQFFIEEIEKQDGNS